MKRKELDYTVEKTVETIKILEVLEIQSISIEKIIERVGMIPILNRSLKPDAVRRILITLKNLNYASQDELTKKWSKGYRSFK